MTAPSAMQSAQLASPPQRAQGPLKLAEFGTVMHQTGLQRISFLIIRFDQREFSPGCGLAVRFCNRACTSASANPMKRARRHVFSRQAAAAVLDFVAR